jgi:hypothetical protein
VVRFDQGRNAYEQFQAAEQYLPVVGPAISYQKRQQFLADQYVSNVEQVCHQESNRLN